MVKSKNDILYHIINKTALKKNIKMRISTLPTSLFHKILQIPATCPSQSFVLIFILREENKTHLLTN